MTSSQDSLAHSSVVVDLAAADLEEEVSVAAVAGPEVAAASLVAALREVGKEHYGVDS